MHTSLYIVYFICSDLARFLTYSGKRTSSISRALKLDRASAELLAERVKQATGQHVELLRWLPVTNTVTHNLL